MKKLSIAILKSDLSSKGGLEKYCLVLTKELVKAGHKVTILTNNSDENQDINVVNFGKKKATSFLHLLKFDKMCKEWLKSNPVDYVFGMDRNFCGQHFYRAGNGVHAAYLDHRRHFSSLLKRISFQINPLHKLILSMEKSTYTSPDLKVLFVNSNMVKDEIIRYYPKCDHNKIKVIHNGVEWHQFEDSFNYGFENRANIRKGLGLNPDAYQFLFIGNEYKRKGLEFLLKAFKSLDRGDVELSVVGKDRNIKYYQELRDKLGLQKRVHFFGPQKSVLPFLQAGDCLTVTSYYDPFANVTVEAQAMGLYTISSSKNGGSEVINSKNIGLVYRDLEDPFELASCMSAALSLPKDMRRAQYIRNNCKELDFSKQIGKMIKCLEEV